MSDHTTPIEHDGFSFEGHFDPEHPCDREAFEPLVRAKFEAWWAEVNPGIPIPKFSVSWSPDSDLPTISEEPQ